MKALDEVIKVFTKCFDNTYNIVPLECEPEYGEDALHYLKMLRDMTCGTSQILRNTSQITCPKCHSEFVILPDTNTPLTWDELKRMTGKPVWLEYNLHISDRDARSRMWIIVQKIMPWRQDDELIYYSGFVFGKKEIGETWQAYRKERP